jgi:DNA-binding NarL/FixJ family response regulator
MTRILVIDDHDVVRKGLITSLKANGFERIDSAVSTKDARSKIATFNPQGIIVDINLPDGSGFDLVTWVRKLSKETAILVLSLNPTDQFAAIAKAAGANAYLSKSQSIDEIIASLRFALSHPHTFTSTFITNTSHDWQLTPREIDVLTLLAHGENNSAISSALYISLSTVKTHISSILRKLDASNRTAAVKAAREKGLLL